MEVSRYCLDTSAYSYFQKGDPAVVELIETAETIVVPSIVIGELAAGFRAGSRSQQNFAVLTEFLANSVVAECPVDHETALIFGELVSLVRSQGRPIPTNDLWIAAVCVQKPVTLLTYDSHFRVIDRISSLILTAA
ncbi:MAG: type II toxin-antitoxin system VapC family toxin [Acidobacteria bacterium]|nr:type II toxin-antitoxin system VapC family toxin [Acidobacteriota bacterium]